MKLGLVCEGSHDFFVLRGLLEDRSIKKLGKKATVEAFHPTIDATSRQVGAGGYDQVKIWCLRNSGTIFQSYLNAPIFQNSPTYDAIIIHLDGDVIEKSPWFTPVQKAEVLGSTTKRIKLIRDEIEGWLGQYDNNKLVCAVPVQHTDTWVLGSIRIGKVVETFETKARLNRFLEKYVSGNNKREKLLAIIPHCTQNLDEASNNIESLREFLTDFDSI